MPQMVTKCQCSTTSTISFESRVLLVSKAPQLSFLTGLRRVVYTTVNNVETQLSFFSYCSKA